MSKFITDRYYYHKNKNKTKQGGGGGRGSFQILKLFKFRVMDINRSIEKCKHTAVRIAPTPSLRATILQASLLTNLSLLTKGCNSAVPRPSIRAFSVMRNDIAPFVWDVRWIIGPRLALLLVSA